jgi:predicted phosphodiesterase
MIFAVISDVHGNLEALTAVMDDIRMNARVDETVFLGDAVGYGANPNEVVGLLDSCCRIKLMGNHDYSALGLLDPAEFNTYAQSGINFSVAVLTPESRRILATFEMTSRIADAFLVHATPKTPESWSYCLSMLEAGRQFGAFAESICFLGHSHQPIVFHEDLSGEIDILTEDKIRLQPGSRYIFNVGSVGQPRDGDPRSCYVLYDTEAQDVTYRRVAYDIQAAQSKMKDVDLPSFLIERLAFGR